MPIGVVLTLCAVDVATGAATRPTTVSTHQTKRGKDLAALNGHALYMFTADRAGASKCTGSCATTWRPLLTSARPVAAAGSGVNAKLLGTIRRANRALQVTYNGHPLYEFAGDRSAGEITGEGVSQFGGKWYIVNPSGNGVKPLSQGSCAPGFIQTSSGCLPQGY